MQNSANFRPFHKRIDLVGTNKTPKVTFRVLPKGEDEFCVKAKGIFAKNTEADNSVEDHISRNGIDSSWVSMTNLLAIAQFWAMKDHCSIAVIDYAKLQDCEIVDARNGLPKLGAMANNFAKSSQEICVHRHIPAEAIITIVPYYRVVMMCVARASERSDRSIQHAGLDNVLRMFEGLANRPETWTDNLDGMIRNSQKLWAVNRYYGDKLKVGF